MLYLNDTRTRRKGFWGCAINFSHHKTTINYALASLLLLEKRKNSIGMESARCTKNRYFISKIALSYSVNHIYYSINNVKVPSLFHLQ